MDTLNFTTRHHPESARAFYRRAILFRDADRFDESVDDFNRAAKLTPDSANTLYERGRTQFARVAGGTVPDPGPVLRTALADLTRSLEIRPDQTRVLLRRGRVFEKMGNHREAERDYSGAIRIDPDNMKPLRSRARVFRKQGKYDEAIRDLKMVMKAESSPIRSIMELAELFRLQGNHAEAIRLLGRAIKLAPDKSALYRYRADAHHGNGDHDRAIEDYTRAGNLDPKDADAFWGRARIYQLIGNLKRAQEDWDRAARQKPHFAEMLAQGAHLEEPRKEVPGDRENTLVNHALASFYRRNFSDTLALINRALEENPKNGHAFYVRSLVRFKQWESSAFNDASACERCLLDLNEAVKFQPKLSTAYALRGRVYEKCGQDADARADFDRALELKPDFAPALVHRGQVELKQGKMEEARKDFDRALQVNPGYSLGHLRRAEIHIHRWRKEGKKPDSPEYRDALANLGAALKTNPCFPEALRLRGQIHLEAGNEKAAFEDFSRSRDIHPRDPVLYNVIGTHLLSQKKYRRAVGQFDHAIASNARHADSWSKRGIARYALGDSRQAISDWETACRIQPSLHRVLDDMIRRAGARK
jgi:tetratricopeptide (TPR) repeat protein